jgi:nucleotide-binding universal stress UspA family protein
MSWQPIIAGIDGSPASLRSARYAWEIARVLDAPCVLVYAVPEVWDPGGVAPLVNTPAIFQALVDDVHRQVETQLGAPIPAAVRDSLIARAGRPAVVLDEVARERNAALIVVGARQHSVLARSFGGSTAHNLVRTSPVPVLVVEAAAPPQVPRRLLVATDVFAAAGPLLSWVRRFAERLGAQVRVLHVVEAAKFPTVVPLSLDIEEFVRRSRIEFERLVERELPDVPPEERIMCRGIADEEIGEAAAAWRADMVVVGSHGKGWVDRLLIGSTTERLLNRLPASLLVVPVGKPAARSPSRRAKVGHLTSPS